MIKMCFNHIIVWQVLHRRPVLCLNISTTLTFYAFSKLIPKNQTSLKIVPPPPSPQDVINNRSLNLHKAFSTFKCHSNMLPKTSETFKIDDVLDVSCNMRIEIAGTIFFPKNKTANLAINRNTLPFPPKKGSHIPNPQFPILIFQYRQYTKPRWHTLQLPAKKIWILSQEMCA